MRRILVTGLAAFAGLAGLAGLASSAGSRFFSTAVPEIAILAGDLFLGKVERNLDGPGSIWMQSRSKPDITCRGQFTYSTQLGDAGNMRCSDGATGTIQFQHVSVGLGYGTGSSSDGPMSLTYGLSANEAAPYLQLR